MYYLDLLISGIAFGCMYAMAAVGLTLVYGLLRILHIAHASVFTLGALIGVAVANQFGNIPLEFLLAILASMIAGCLIYRCVYEPLLRQPPLVPLLASIGLLIMMEDGFRIVFGEQGLTLQNNPYYLRAVQIGGVSFNVIYLALAGFAIVTLGALTFFVDHTRTGVAWRATVSRPEIAINCGVDVVKVRYLAFAIGSALAAIAGMLVAGMDNLVEPTFGAVVSYKALAIIVLGGLGNMQGALIASLVLGIMESFGIGIFGAYLDRDAIAAIVLIVALMINPNGLGRPRTVS